MQRSAYVNVDTKEIVRDQEITEYKHVTKRRQSNLTSGNV